ncbi:MAG: HEAT repeat domain-containing protein [Sandaracinaceae bacterium]|nr:HEAT repeat domain-containing protein [Sandaracinaceae bacterium]
MSRKGLLALSVVALAAASVFTLRSRGATVTPGEVAEQAPRMRCAFEVGETRAFRIAMDSRDGDGSTSPLGASLFLRTLTEPRGLSRAATVAGLMVPDDAADASEGLDEPFLIRMNTKCRFEAFAFRESVDGATAASIEGTVRMFEVVGGDTHDATWEASQHDLNGEFFAAYERTAYEGQELSFTRRAETYSEGSVDATMIRMLENHASGTFDGTWGFVSALSGRVRHRVRMGARPIELTIDFSLERTDADAPAGLPHPGDTALFAFREQREGAPVHREPEVIGGMHRDEIVALDAEAVMTQALALWNASTNPAHEEAYQFLLAWIRGHEGGADALVAAIREGELDPALHAMAFLVLGTADTPASRQALALAMTEQDLSPMNRRRAAFSLGTNTTPTLESFESMRVAAEANARSTDDEGVRGVIMRSMGPFAGDEAPEEVRTEARAYIRELASASDPARRLAGIDAAGNAGTDVLLDAIEGGFTDADETVRASAYHALRGMRRDLVQPVVADALTRETSDVVRRSLVEAAYTNAQQSSRPVVSPELATATAATLSNIADPGARAAAIHLVGIAAETQPEARAALAAWLANEPTPENLQILGRYVSVDEARAALAQREP